MTLPYNYINLPSIIERPYLEKLPPYIVFFPCDAFRTDSADICGNAYKTNQGPLVKLQCRAFKIINKKPVMRFYDIVYLGNDALYSEQTMPALFCVKPNTFG